MQPTDAAFFSLFLKDALLLSFAASHIPRFFVRLKKKKERKKMAPSRGGDCNFCGPGQQKSWRTGKGENIWWCNQKMLRRLLCHLTMVDAAFEGLAFEGRKGWVLQSMQPLNWDTTTVSLLAQLAVQLARLPGKRECLHR